MSWLRGTLLSSHPQVWLTALIVVQAALYSLITVISSRFAFENAGSSRPLIAFFAILAGCFLAYLCSIPLALRLADSGKWLAVFFGVAVAFRGIVLVSEPIQEVDIYRYSRDI